MGGRPPARSGDRWLLYNPRGDGAGGGLPAQGSMRALNTLAMPRPMPAAAAHSRASGHENRVLVGSTAKGSCVLADDLVSGPHELPGEQPAQQADAVETSFHIRSRVTLRIYLVVILAVLVALTLDERSRDIQDHPSLVSQAALRF